MRLRWTRKLIAPLTVAAFMAGARVPAFADTVTCKDGTSSQSGRGACSHHGGVAAMAAPAPAPTHPSGQVAAPKAAPPPAALPPAAPPPSSHSTARSTTHAAPPPAGHPTAQCRDGNWSYAQHHSGACSRHGGVARWTDTP
ncbi:MAG TPA: DUF3761 domain-containing protein [Polyangia bacterium]|nr:DUF3761 domain-containing protein [Polyangia bacterium]